MITGHSGAGKSEAIAAFEDGGYFCVDNLPPRMIAYLGKLFRHEGSGVEKAAVVSDVRGGDYFDDLLQVLGELEKGGMEPRVLFMEADEETLLDRYKETRRRHPLARRGGSSTASARSARCWRRCASAPTSSSTRLPHRRRPAAPHRQEMLGHQRERQAGADPAHLRLQERAAPRRGPHPRRAFPAQPPLRRRAAPADRARRAVEEYVEAGTQAGEFYGRLMPPLDFLVPAYVAEGKST